MKRKDEIKEMLTDPMFYVLCFSFAIWSFIGNAIAYLLFK
jgi:hypothetical protein